MESKDYDFNIFQDLNEMENMYNVLPFNNLTNDIEDNNFYDFLNIDFCSNYTKNIPGNSEQIIEKLNKIEEDYNNLLHDNISAPTISKFNFIRLKREIDGF